ncbi:MAG TPA: RNA polymerase subunit sigma [Cytophagales bacterium]|nr:RNA polymerase subunit sigma [Cytophagales bacterium]HAA17936.1 RNA polymerase subunit sigma [Cytophagales bacterium]HAP62756.1 RNA polymerase subunit sigma [Cytophagales bacterium]
MKSTCDQVFPVFEAFRDELERYIRRKVGNDTVAEDLTGSLALRLYDQCEKLPDVHNVRAWLYRLAHNAAMDYHREQARVVQTHQEWGLEEDDEVLNTSAEVCAVRLLEELPETYRVPLKMSDLEGMPQKEIAQQLQLNYSTVKMRVQRGREKLKALLVDCMEHDKLPNTMSCAPSETCRDC